MRITPQNMSHHSGRRGSVRTRSDIRPRRTSFGPELISTRYGDGWGTRASIRRTYMPRSISMPRQRRWQPVLRAGRVDLRYRGSRQRASWSFFEACNQHSNMALRSGACRIPAWLAAARTFAVKSEPQRTLPGCKIPMRSREYWGFWTNGCHFKVNLEISGFALGYEGGAFDGCSSRSGSDSCAGSLGHEADRRNVMGNQRTG